MTRVWRMLVAACFVAAAGLWGAAGTRAQDLPVIEEVVPPPELGRTAQIDIARMTWRVAGSDGAALARPDYDDSSWVARAGVSQEILRNAVAWYRFNFLLAPGTEGLGSRLELGGVEGNVSVYLNGTLVGEMRGETQPPYERRESFTLPAALLTGDRNVLALRLSGFAGRAKVGIPRGPIRLFPLSKTYERDDRALRALQEADRRNALQAAISAATGSLAFGRFGRSHSEGLLTCALRPAGFQSATTSADPAPAGAVFGTPSALDQVALEAISPEGKQVRVQQALGGRYRLFYPLMYPGFAIEPLGATLSVRFDRPLDALWVDRWGIATASAPGARVRLPWTESWVLFHDRAGSRPPILVSLPSPALPLRLDQASGGFSVELPAGAMARFCWPTGIAAWGGAPDRDAMARFRAWADAMVPFSRTAEETARGARLAVRERFGYLRAGAIPYAPLPPVFGAVLAGGGELSAPRARDLGVPTLAGPLWADRRAAEIAYDLPLPDTRIRAVPRIDGAPAESAGELPDPLAGNAADLAFSRRADLMARWPRLSRPARQALESNGQAQLTRAWGPSSWAETVEPLTGTAYRWTAAEVGADGRVRGISRPNGLALAGTSLFGAFTGDWSIPAVAWVRVRRAFDWLTHGLDWAWQGVVDSDSGQSAGDEASLEGAYLGAIGYARLAEAIAPADAAAGLALAARLAPLREGRAMISRYAASAGLLAPGSVFVALTEEGVYRATASEPVPAATPGAPVPGDLAPAQLLSWTPARLEDLVWKPKARTLEIKLSLKQATDRLAVRVSCPRPADVQINGQPGDADYDARQGILTYRPDRATGSQALALRF